MASALKIFLTSLPESLQPIRHCFKLRRSALRCVKSLCVMVNGLFAVESESVVPDKCCASYGTILLLLALAGKSTTGVEFIQGHCITPHAAGIEANDFGVICHSL